MSEQMKAIGVEEYGSVKNLQYRDVPKPGSPQGHDLLIRYASPPQRLPSFVDSTTHELTTMQTRVQAMSVNPIDTKVRNGTYDDAPGMIAPSLFPILCSFPMTLAM